ncbi:hypothetical protein [Streptomyces sp. NPDC015131]|uniref:hypothetical protein n=1 Tax=Streptomyces sp. NPDC015131 TaxID=3364941 RepID=UPI0037004280
MRRWTASALTEMVLLAQRDYERARGALRASGAPDDELRRFEAVLRRRVLAEAALREAEP